MDNNNSTEYCSFVSVDYIICECGESFADEDTLKIHLESDHVMLIEEAAPTAMPVPKLEESEVKDEPAEPDEPEVEYIIQNPPDPEWNSLQYILPQDIKQENIIVQFVDESQSNQLVIERNASGVNTLACRRVVFPKELGGKIVILDQENVEHDYDKEVPVPKTEYFYCDVCGRSFPAERSLRLHMYMHDKDKLNNISGRKRSENPKTKKLVKKTVCDVCGKKFTSNASLRYHQRIHTGEKPYPCQYCPKAFAMRLFQQIHERIHTGERPYQCPHCPKAFGNKAAILRHNRVHTGVKPYTCPECGKTFTQSNSMKLHYQTVHLKMPAPYKSASRKLRAAQRAAGQSLIPTASLPSQPSVRKVKKVPEYTQNVGTTSNNLQEINQLEYVVEEGPFSDDDYGTY